LLAKRRGGSIEDDEDNDRGSIEDDEDTVDDSTHCSEPVTAHI
jgi:hypothetical protein